MKNNTTDKQIVYIIRFGEKHQGHIGNPSFEFMQKCWKKRYKNLPDVKMYKRINNTEVEIDAITGLEKEVQDTSIKPDTQSL